jgi:hypothetical protein
MSEKWQHIRGRLLDLGWDVSVLDKAEAEVRQEGYQQGYADAVADAPKPRRRRKQESDR